MSDLVRARARLAPMLLVVALALSVLPWASPAEARAPRHTHAQVVAAQKAERAHQRALKAHRAAVKRAERIRAKQAAARKRALKIARKRAAARAALIRKLNGTPPRSYVVPPGAYFSYPNRTRKESLAIRDRVLLTVRSTWGGRRNHLGYPMPTNGSIRIATWTFDDWPMARALVAARNRGVNVQVVAAKAANQDIASWHWLRRKLGQRLYRPGYPATAQTASFARVCRGACRGPGGTPHAKYFLFDNVGAQHTHDVVVQTSMNLTEMAYQGQWNQAQVLHSAQVYDDFASVYGQARLARPQAVPYHVRSFGTVVNLFFPRPQATAAQDPVMQMLNQVRCTGATSGGTGTRTKIRIIQYAIYGDRGVWIAKKLRYLWNHGCDVAIIYSVSSRPVLGILRNRSGRGAIPMKQSVIKDYWGNIVKYNHSKWMTITGHWGSNTAAYVTFSGSANWANLAFGDDEQMQRIESRVNALRYLATFAKTWRQQSSRPPTPGVIDSWARTAAPLKLDEPAEAPAWGTGVFRYMDED